MNPPLAQDQIIANICQIFRSLMMPQQEKLIIRICAPLNNLQLDIPKFLEREICNWICCARKELCDVIEVFQNLTKYFYLFLLIICCAHIKFIRINTLQSFEGLLMIKSISKHHVRKVPPCRDIKRQTSMCFQIYSIALFSNSSN